MKIASILFILVTLGVIYLISFSPVFKIKSFSISPDEFECGKSDDIKKYTLLLGMNFFSLDKFKIEKNIKDNFFCIGSIELVKSFPDKVKLDLKPRQGILNLIPLDSSQSAEATPSARKIATESGFLVDSESVIFNKANFETNLKPVFFNGSLSVGQRLSNGLAEKVLKILKTLEGLGLSQTDAKIYSSDNFSIGLGPKILFKLNDTLERQLASLQLIVNQAKIDEIGVESIDLRFDKPIVKYGKRQSNLRN